MPVNSPPHDIDLGRASVVVGHRRSRRLNLRCAPSPSTMDHRAGSPRRGPRSGPRCENRPARNANPGHEVVRLPGMAEDGTPAPRGDGTVAALVQEILSVVPAGCTWLLPVAADGEVVDFRIAAASDRGRDIYGRGVARVDGRLSELYPSMVGGPLWQLYHQVLRHRRARAAGRLPVRGAAGRHRRGLAVRRERPPGAGRPAGVVAAPGRGPAPAGADRAAGQSRLGRVRPGHRAQRLVARHVPDLRT